MELPARAVALPTVGVVTVVAGALKLHFLKSPVVGIGMAVIAGAVSQSLHADGLLAGARSVAFLAGDGRMPSRKREVRRGMVEPGRGLEGFLVVAAETLAAELTQVRVLLLTTGALAAQAEEGPVEVLHLDFGPVAAAGIFAAMWQLWHFCCRCFPTSSKPVWARWSNFWRSQADERDRLPFMFGMAAAAIRFVRRFLYARE